MSEVRSGRVPRGSAVRAVAALLLLGSLSACGLLDREQPARPTEPLAAESPSSASGATEPGLRRYYEQDVTWEPCRESMECTDLEVPLDYDKPSGKAITLAVLKVPATEPDQRVGSLVVNPGGPGVSGVEYAAGASSYFGEDVRAAFDVVGFDPRGVAGSTPIDCVTDEQLDDLVAADPDPDTPQEAARGDALLRGMGEGCLARSGALTRHVSTQEAARDIDVLRAVLGQDQLAYFGASYGTFLGATYAEQFPERVGRMVLDGAVDPSVGAVAMSRVQARGFEVALRAYVAQCVEDGNCFLGDSVDEGVRTVQGLLDRVDAQPLPGAGGRELTEGRAVLGIWAPLYNRDYWSALDQGLQDALDGDGRTLLTFSDAYVNRGPEGYRDNSTEALYAVNCLDRDESVPLDKVERYVPRLEKASPTFGRIFAYGLTACGSWPVHSGKGPHELHARGAEPIMVVGTTRDPATPLTWARSLADQLESGVLVTRDGDGHTGYGAGNTCVDEAVEAYLVSGTVPEQDVSC